MQSWLPLLLWTLPGVLLTCVTAIALNRWAGDRTPTRRAVLATAASGMPFFCLLLWMFVTIDDFISLVLSMDLEEFVIPALLQLAATLILAAPLGWGLSRRSKPQKSTAAIFE
ncbi:hypothetical protein [Novosphingobium colocasiae]|uniref:hypothetical protein n=1 Tax=Novosphingobium colocasiae TaxID=1256513 RepID=UPI0016734B6E|nr:hypothetical protein [Novosphingobium colocasiae]